MIVGYAPASPVEQTAGFEAQKRASKGGRRGEDLAEQVSSVPFRALLEAALDFIRSGDVLVGTKLDRLAAAKGVSLCLS
jgi:DNA invertase Pin-like site-specific DNA recombinase